MVKWLLAFACSWNFDLADDACAILVTLLRGPGYQSDSYRFVHRNHYSCLRLQNLALTGASKREMPCWYLATSGIQSSLCLTNYAWLRSWGKLVHPNSLHSFQFKVWDDFLFVFRMASSSFSVSYSRASGRVLLVGLLRGSSSSSFF